MYFFKIIFMFISKVHIYSMAKFKTFIQPKSYRKAQIFVTDQCLIICMFHIISLTYLKLWPNKFELFASCAICKWVIIIECIFRMSAKLTSYFDFVTNTCHVNVLSVSCLKKANIFQYLESIRRFNDRRSNMRMILLLL